MYKLNTCVPNEFMRTNWAFLYKMIACVPQAYHSTERSHSSRMWTWPTEWLSSGNDQAVQIHPIVVAFIPRCSF